MGSNTYKVTLRGATPLLMHQDNLGWEERVQAWLRDPANGKLVVPGDDRTPAWKWIGCLYSHQGRVILDSDNLMSMLRDGGAKCPLPRGRGTFKAATQAGLVVNEIGWPLVVGGGVVPTEGIFALANELDFKRHEELAEQLGFSLFVKRARIGKGKHVRVRPRFEEWSASGTITVLDENITKEALRNILSMAGVYCGLCDWRPGTSGKPGLFGKFFAEVE